MGPLPSSASKRNSMDESQFLEQSQSSTTYNDDLNPFAQQQQQPAVEEVGIKEVCTASPFRSDYEYLQLRTQDKDSKMDLKALRVRVYSKENILKEQQELDEFEQE